MADDVTTDKLLGERLVLNQSRNGYRVAIDPVLLAACIKLKPGEHVLDMGCGSGAASLCLAARLPEVTVDGLELMPQMFDLAERNVQANNMQDRIRVVAGDVAHPPSEITSTPYDHVMSNPPYMRAGSGNIPPDPVKAAAMVEGKAGLASWVSLAGNVLRHKGTLSLVHRTDRLSDILGCLEGRFGGVVIFPLWPDESHIKPSKRVLVQAVKGVNTPLSLMAGLALHAQNGDYTPAADAVLRGGKMLNIDA